MIKSTLLHRSMALLCFALGNLLLLSTQACAPALSPTIISQAPTSTPITPLPTLTQTPTTLLSPTSTALRVQTAQATSTQTPRPTRTPLLVTPVRPTVARTVVPTRAAAPRRTPTLPAVGPSPTPRVSSQVNVSRNGDQFTLMVNGKPTYIKGMNYNINYTELPEDTQLKLHRRDFKIMRDAGVNAIIGWGIYDETTLQVAEEFGIGVIMPFELDPNGSYENEDYRNQLLADFCDYIKRYKDFPAVWGWNPGGDELIYRMKTEQGRTVDKLQIAADLEFEMAAAAHAIDPNHINVIKEPRDWYIKYLNVALQQAKSQPGYQDLGSSLIYGVNVYGHVDDIKLALTNAKLTLTGQLGLATMVSEFGPFNSPREERAADYADIWDAVTPITTIGAMVYVFGPDQPNPTVANPYDPLTLLPSEYSLVDLNGAPVDSALAALTNKWRSAGAPVLLPPTTPTVKP